ncbi:MAG: S1 RNA-binding domain-containing protein, partial [Spirochaetales bacterium]
MEEMEVETNETQNSDKSIQTQLQEEYLKALETLEEGQLIEGQVVQVTSDDVFVDVGYKSEGKIPKSEFAEVPKIGDTVNVVLITKEGKHGELVVSKKKAESIKIWKNLKQAYADKTLVEGTVEKSVKGGFEVNFGADIRGFLPLSQADTHKIVKPEKLVGTTSLFYIDRLYTERKANIVANRRKRRGGW